MIEHSVFLKCHLQKHNAIHLCRKEGISCLDAPAHAPFDLGDSLGVGEYCTTDGGQCDDNPSATTCSALLNGDLIVTSYVCTLVCDETTECGEGASCRCPLFKTGGQICGCIQDSCVMPPGSEGELGMGGGAN